MLMNVSEADPKRDLLRHALATLAYRGGKAVRGAPASFAAFRASETSRTPAQLVAHIGDLLDWALLLADGRYDWHDSEPLEWEKEIERFFAALAALNARLASGEPLKPPEEKIFQGPIADALTHVGQIVMLRRLAGAPMRSENYFRARIAAGEVGANQPAPAFEFD